MKEENKRKDASSPAAITDTTVLLEEYKKQVADDGVHSYSETFHHEYYDYSDSNCCC